MTKSFKTPIARLTLAKKSTAAIWLIAAMTAFHPGVAAAQTVAPAAAPVDTGEIIVTAQKRKENAKNVPVSITVLKGSALEQQKVADFQDLGRIVPGLSVTNTGSSSLSRLQLRGISSEQGSSTVGVYLDDISLTTPNLFQTGETLPRLFDLDHVEVLRGPQGTLFGASSMGGTIRFLSNQPNLDKVEGYVRGDVSTTRHAGTNYLLEGVVNLPIVTDKLALRVGVQQSNDTGFVTRYDGGDLNRNGMPHGNIGDEHTIAVRASLLYKPTEEISIEPALLYQYNRANGTSIFELEYLPAYRQDKLTAEYVKDRLIVPSLTMHYDTDDLQFTSISAYLRRTNDRLTDAQYYDGEFVAYELDPTGGAIYNTLANLPSPYHNNVTVNQYTQEFRIGSPSIDKSHKPYEWQIGGYYFNQKVLTLDDEYLTGLGNAITQIFGEDPATVLGAPLINDELGAYHYTYHTKEFALFAQGSYKILPKLKGTVGLRQSFANASYSVDEFGYFLIGAPAFASGTSKEHPLLPKFSLTYEADRQATFYATAAKGYRLGGHNLPLPPGSCGAPVEALGLSAPDNYTSDSLWSYEGGAKLRLFNGKLSVNGSGFYIDWKNIQQNVSIPPPCGYSITVNAGNARSYGGELEINARLTKALSLGASASVTNAKITQAAEGSGASDGQSVLFVPHDTFTFSGDYDQPIDDRFTFHGHVDANVIGSSHGSFQLDDTDYNRPSYTVVNMNMGLTRGPLDLSLFVRNLLDEDTIIQRPSVLAQNQGLRIRPRTIGGSAMLKF